MYYRLFIEFETYIVKLFAFIIINYFGLEPWILFSNCGMIVVDTVEVLVIRFV